MKSPSTSRLIALAAIVAPSCLLAQNGDRPGHVMTPPPAHWVIPPAPVVKPEEAAGTMRLEPGFELELVASEPMLHDPVALAFDGNGRIWLAEMVGYMPDIDGKLEDSTYGRISVIEDTDGDGRADKQTVFLEQYLLPRAVALTDNDGTLLFADNEKLYEAEILIDESGSIKAGEVKVVDEGYAKGGNPEHKPNGLMRAIDNWFYSAKSDNRYRKVNGTWIKEKTETRGQWGISQDDYGRLFTNTNSNLVSVEELPPGLRTRNSNYTFRTNVNSTIKNQQLWPARINPGVNRGYMEGTLDDTGHLVKPTAASGLVVYRGDQFPEAYRGNLFITEPAGNLVKRAVMTEGEDGFRTVASALTGSEFLASIDERSRMVNAYTAPDGSLYLIDFYRGIIQHKEYMTSYLRAQVVERKLDQHIGLGRIWRVRHVEGKALDPAPRMSENSTAELVAYLSHPNGWWRDTAQRLIVERGGKEAVPALLKIIEEDSNELAMIHAVWTLEGLGQLDLPAVTAALKSLRPRFVAETVRAAESFAGTENAGEAFALLAPLAATDNLFVRRQLSASLGLFGEEAVPVLVKLVARHAEDRLLGDLAVSGLSGRELTLLKGLPAKHNLRSALIETLVKRNQKNELSELAGLLKEPGEFRALAKASAMQRRNDESLALLALVADRATSKEVRKSIVDGLLEGARDKKFKPMPVKHLEPLELAASTGLLDADKHKKLAALFKVGSGEEESFLLTEAHRAQYKLGEVQYQRICMGCHQIHGNGQQYIAPPLAGSEWVLESEKRLVAIVMDGVMGPIEVLGKTYTVPEIQPMMPGLRLNPEFTDEQLAAIMTYVRNTWDNGAPPIATETVTRYRETVAPRAPWSPDELKALK
ncbi:MAG: c-type cytochrome [Verrucomicrobiae bacterium]|nr:c-type cytochrome [Verrucomicrobiae bacterium]